MEGRHPPPEAKHPFPDYPNMKKFWGTPLSSGFFRAFCGFWLTYGSVMWLNFYITRNEVGPFGMDLSYTDEQIEMSRKLGQVAHEIRHVGKGVHVGYSSKAVEPGRDMRFDDSVVFIPSEQMRRDRML